MIITPEKYFDLLNMSRLDSPEEDKRRVTFYDNSAQISSCGGYIEWRKLNTGGWVVSVHTWLNDRKLIAELHSANKYLKDSDAKTAFLNLVWIYGDRDIKQEE